ncbi:hypothetical protein LUZ63_011010 [Rhynchospora breviuscula]|uniref:F-box domain-containing protein n=1 Tax=Rhynchospora breviuscula TaxID=2022672 RepID=A0A9Q0CIJ5_9POAL|nr:hypothetical protein LUZ63_011010 [Rhynchospora breviuscula]
MMRTQELEIDKMRNLPHDLILGILELSLSSMKARAAVQACMLFKGWNHLWPFFSCLDFDLSEFNSGDPIQDKQRFSCFVSTMLEHRKAPKVDKFGLACVNLCEEQYSLTITQWIMYALQHQVKVLELALCSWIGSLMTRWIHVAFDSLEELHLRLNDCSCLCHPVNMTTLSIFPRLQRLNLHSQRMMYGHFFKDLFSRCPFLKDLRLESFIVPYSSIIRAEHLERLSFKNCNLKYKVGTDRRVYLETKKINFSRLQKLFYQGKDLSFGWYIMVLISGCPLLEDLWLESFSVPFGSAICSPKLQNLTLKNCKNTDRFTKIVAPGLVSFCFIGLIEDAAPLVHKVGSISSLIHAKFSLHDNSFDSYFLERALRSLSYVKNLELCVNELTPSPQSPPYYPALYNLKSLSFCGHCSNYVIYMCKDMPNLEKISFWPYCQHSPWFFEVLILFR